MTAHGRVVYDDGFLSVHVEEVDIDGARVPFSTVHLGPGVVVIAMSTDGTVHLVEEFRRARGAPSLECVGGRVEEGESVEQAAKRELREETGIEAVDWTKLGEFWPHTSKVVATASIWLATGLTFNSPSPEPGERIRVIPTPLTEAMAMVRDCRIVHAPSALAVLLTSLAHQAPWTGHGGCEPPGLASSFNWL